MRSVCIICVFGGVYILFVFYCDVGGVGEGRGWWRGFPSSSGKGHNKKKQKDAHLNLFVAEG